MCMALRNQSTYEMAYARAHAKQPLTFTNTKEALWVDLNVPGGAKT